MKIKSTSLPEVELLTPMRWGDDRGYFVEVFNRATLLAGGIDLQPVQENQSFSRSQGTVRGLHYQRAPFAQAKLVRVLQGAIFDVAVDIRRESPTFGAWTSAVLTSDGGEQLYIPTGFAHGFCTLAPNTEVAYMVDCHYTPEADAAIRFDDPAIGIVWPAAAEVILSAKDAAAPLLEDARLD